MTTENKKKPLYIILLIVAFLCSPLGLPVGESSGFFWNKKEEKTKEKTADKRADKTAIKNANKAGRDIKKSLNKGLKKINKDTKGSREKLNKATKDAIGGISGLFTKDSKKNKDK